jgi:membrane dipeptidase
MTMNSSDSGSLLHSKAIVIDGLAPWGNLDHLTSFDEMREGGMTACNLTVAVHTHDFLGAIHNIAKYKAIVDTNSSKMRLVTRVSDIRAAKEEGRVGIILGFQDGKPLEDKIEYLGIFYDLGVRIIGLTYNAQNFIGTGCCELTDGKLTYLGHEVVKEINRLGIVICLSHCADATTMDAIEVSEDPVVFSHSGVRAMCNAYGRNKTDEQIKALAEKGGVIGICPAPFFVKRDPKTYQVLESTVDDVLDQVEYVVKLVGIDHVGFGTDMVGHWLDREVIWWDTGSIGRRLLLNLVFDGGGLGGRMYSAGGQRKNTTLIRKGLTGILNWLI